MPKTFQNHHRRAVLAAGALLLCAAPLGALAQDKYPSKPVTLVVPQAAGGANDAIARVLAQRLSEQMGQSVVVDNRPGAGGTLATAALARAKHDGYTLLVTADSAHVIGPALYKNAGFDAVKDFEPVAPIATAGYVLVAHPSFPAKNVAELIALAKASPGKYAIASAGNGTLNHLIGEMLQYSRYSSFTYWVGATVVFVSFIVVSRESDDAEDSKKNDDLERAASDVM